MIHGGTWFWNAQLILIGKAYALGFITGAVVFWLLAYAIYADRDDDDMDEVIQEYEDIYGDRRE